MAEFKCDDCNEVLHISPDQNGLDPGLSAIVAAQINIHHLAGEHDRFSLSSQTIEMGINKSTYGFGVVLTEKKP